MNKSTVTIGIPAYNEERNIAALLESIFSQKQTFYKLASVLVVSDGCKDKTASIVEALAIKYKKIKLIVRKERYGKSNALNMIYKINRSDFLLTIDADLVLAKNDTIDQMVKTIVHDERLKAVGARHIPVKPTTLMGKFAYVSYLSFEDALLNLNDGNNFYGMMAANLIRKNLTKSFKYPKGTISDQNYLYAMAAKNNRAGFKLAKNAFVLFTPVSTFMDWRILSVRSVIGDKEDVVKYFGEQVLEYYTMPKMLLIKSLVKWFLKSPIYTLGSILMNWYVRLFPYYKVTPKDGKWELAASSKELIKVT